MFTDRTKFHTFLLLKILCRFLFTAAFKTMRLASWHSRPTGQSFLYSEGDHHHHFNSRNTLISEQSKSGNK